MDSHISEAVKSAADLGAIGGTVAILAGWLPSLAAVLTVAWLAVRLYNEVAKAIYWHRKRKVDPEI